MIMSCHECFRLSTAVHLYMYSIEPAIVYLILEKMGTDHDCSCSLGSLWFGLTRRQLSPLHKEGDNNLKCTVTVTVMYFRPEEISLQTH